MSLDKYRPSSNALRQRIAKLGKPSGINLDKALLLASELELELELELESEYTLKKMELRK